jgi:hypothetical protein
MKKLFLLGLMTMLAGSAWAEWVMFTKAKNEEVTHYFDPATIRKDGNMRRVWQLNDLSKRDKAGEMSRRMRFEYDCKQERYRVLGFSIHSEHMASGTVLLYAGEDNNWREIAPETVAEKLLKIACAK